MNWQLRIRVEPCLEALETCLEKLETCLEALEIYIPDSSGSYILLQCLRLSPTGPKNIIDML